MDIVRTNLRIACALRHRNNYSEISRDAGLSRNILAQFLTGSKSMGYANLLSICDTLDVPIGLLDTPDSITLSRIEHYKMLMKAPDQVVSRAFAEISRWLDDQPAGEPRLS